MNVVDKLPDPVHDLSTFIRAHPRLTILTGAGCSTPSGIPDYRDDDGNWKHAKPMQYADFIARPDNRRRYWARSFAGWHRIAAARPNDAHLAIADLEKNNRANCVITQNVDDLHRKAGSRNVIDLHGVLNRVRCLACEAPLCRYDFQVALQQANPDWDVAIAVDAPDGDAHIGDRDTSSFVVPDCKACGGILKPDVVFFGESIPVDRVANARRALQESDALLVVGSSLMVFSGYRFVREASEAGIPVAVLNLGTTRADDLVDLKIAADCAMVLSAATAKLAA